MLILVLDCCGPSCGVGVWQDGAWLASALEPMERGQDARLMPLVMAAMAQAGCGFADLDKIAVTRGPGSFTGARVGLAAARGLGLASGKPVIGIDRFSIYKRLYRGGGDLLVVINSKRAELFCRFFPAQGAAQDPCLMTQEQIDAFLAAHPAQVAGDADLPGLDVLDACAQLASGADAHSEECRPSPLYLRPPDVSVAKKA